MVSHPANLGGLEVSRLVQSIAQDLEAGRDDLSAVSRGSSFNYGTSEVRRHMEGSGAPSTAIAPSSALLASLVTQLATARVKDRATLGTAEGPALGETLPSLSAALAAALAAVDSRAESGADVAVSRRHVARERDSTPEPPVPGLREPRPIRGLAPAIRPPPQSDDLSFRRAVLAVRPSDNLSVEEDPFFQEAPFAPYRSDAPGRPPVYSEPDEEGWMAHEIREVAALRAAERARDHGAAAAAAGGPQGEDAEECAGGPDAGVSTQPGALRRKRSRAGRLATGTAAASSDSDGGAAAATAPPPRQASKADKAAAAARLEEMRREADMLRAENARLRQEHLMAHRVLVVRDAMLAALEPVANAKRRARIGDGIGERDLAEMAAATEAATAAASQSGSIPVRSESEASAGVSSDASRAPLETAIAAAAAATTAATAATDATAATAATAAAAPTGPYGNSGALATIAAQMPANGGEAGSARGLDTAAEVHTHFGETVGKLHGEAGGAGDFGLTPAGASPAGPSLHPPFASGGPAAGAFEATARLGAALAWRGASAARRASRRRRAFVRQVLRAVEATLGAAAARWDPAAAPSGRAGTGPRSDPAEALAAGVARVAHLLGAVRQHRRAASLRLRQSLMGTVGGEALLDGSDAGKEGEYGAGALDRSPGPDGIYDSSIDNQHEALNSRFAQIVNGGKGGGYVPSDSPAAASGGEGGEAACGDPVGALSGSPSAADHDPDPLPLVALDAGNLAANPILEAPALTLRPGYAAPMPSAWKPVGPGATAYPSDSNPGLEALKRLASDPGGARTPPPRSPIAVLLESATPRIAGTTAGTGYIGVGEHARPEGDATSAPPPPPGGADSGALPAAGVAAPPHDASACAGDPPGSPGAADRALARVDGIDIAPSSLSSLAHAALSAGQDAAELQGASRELWSTALAVSALWTRAVGVTGAAVAHVAAAPYGADWLQLSVQYLQRRARERAGDDRSERGRGRREGAAAAAEPDAAAAPPSGLASASEEADPMAYLGISRAGAEASAISGALTAATAGAAAAAAASRQETDAREAARAATAARDHDSEAAADCTDPEPAARPSHLEELDED